MSSPADELHALLDERDAEIARLRAALEEIDALSTVETAAITQIARAALAGKEEKP